MTGFLGEPDRNVHLASLPGAKPLFLLSATYVSAWAWSEYAWQTQPAQLQHKHANLYTLHHDEYAALLVMQSIVINIRHCIAVQNMWSFMMTLHASRAAVKLDILTLALGELLTITMYVRLVSLCQVAARHCRLAAPLRAAGEVAAAVPPLQPEALPSWAASQKRARLLVTLHLLVARHSSRSLSRK